MGDRPSAREAAAHERDHDVHVRQLAADIQHHDGLHVVQEPNHRPGADESGVYAV